MTSKQDDRIDGRPFYLEEVTIEEPSTEIKYDKVIVEPVNNNPLSKLRDHSDAQSEAPSEALNDTIDGLRTASGNKKQPNIEETLNSDNESVDSNTSHFNENPCVIEDFVRNFLLRSGMFRTLEAFQAEWFEKKCTHEENIGITNEESSIVPNVYAKNELLNDKVVNLTRQADKTKSDYNKLKEEYEKLGKERDFHRMHHRRITQEKDKLLNDIKRQSLHYKNYEPTLKELRKKYEIAMKEKMLSNLERDRAVAHFNAISDREKFRDAKGNVVVGEGEVGAMLGTGFREDRETGKMGPTQHNLMVERNLVYDNKLMEKQKYQEEVEGGSKGPGCKHPKDSEWPADRRVNPNLSKITQLPKFNYNNLKMDSVIPVSELPVSCVALHPTKEIILTGSDDQSWYLWAVPNHKSRNDAAMNSELDSSNHSAQILDPKSPRFSQAELLMTGVGHSDWISSCDFHPSGNMIVTGAGDATVRLWDLNEQAQVFSFNDHQNAVWDVSFHCSGDFVASGSMDCKAKLWDLHSLRCRTTLSGHFDSINTLEFLPFSNTLLTASADKTVKLWDARTQLCAHTYNGHIHSINSAKFSARGDRIVSCDSFGIVNMWDVRNTRESLSSRDIGAHAANTCTIHPSGDFIVVGCADGTVKVLEGETLDVRTINVADQHTDSVNGIVLGHDGDSIFSVGSDTHLRIWR